MRTTESSKTARMKENKPERGFGLQVRDGDFIELEFKLSIKIILYIVKVIWIWKGLICLSRFWFLSRFCLKAEFWQTNLVCLLEFWFVCQHFGLFASTLVNQIANKLTKCWQKTQFGKITQYSSPNSSHSTAAWRAGSHLLDFGPETMQICSRS